MSTRTSVDIAESTRADSYYCEVPHEPCAVIMFGASGDLAKRKLLPALYDLAIHACLAPRFRLLGFARTPMSDEQFRSVTAQAITKKDGPGAEEAKREHFASQTAYFAGDYNDPDSYRRLAERLEELDREGQLGGNRLFYVATPPEVYPHIVEQLGRAGRARWSV